MALPEGCEKTSVRFRRDDFTTRWDENKEWIDGMETWVSVESEPTRACEWKREDKCHLITLFVSWCKPNKLIFGLVCAGLSDAKNSHIIQAQNVPLQSYPSAFSRTILTQKKTWNGKHHLD